MKKLVLPFLLATSLSLSLAAATPDETELRQLDHELVVATLQNDLKWFEQHLTDDYVLITGNAKVKTKADLIKELDSKIKIEPYDSTEVTIRIYGNSAVITGRIVQRYDYNGEHIEADLRYTDVWVKTNGAWKNVAGHASPIAIKRNKI